MKRGSSVRIVRSTCGLCAIGCGILVHIREGKVVKVEGDPQHPLNHGRLCVKGEASLELLYHPDRLMVPLRRKGRRGEGKWEEISWDEALTFIVGKLSQAKETYGAPSVAFIHGAAKGLQDSYLARFANLYGSPNVAWQGHVCFVPRVVASRLTYGFYAIPDYDFPPECIVVWGKNISETLFHAHDRILNALEKGTRLIVIDTRKTNLAERANIWLQPRPGSDLLLALGMIHTLISEGHYDREFVESWTTGFEQLREKTSAYPLEKVSELTWVPEEKIRKAVELYANSCPSVIQWGNLVDHGMNSFPLARSICILRALAGNIGIPGGEAQPVKFPLHGRRSPELEAWDQMSGEVFEKRLGPEKGPLPMIRYIQPQDVINGIMEGRIRMVYNQGGNPLTNYANAQRVFTALKKLEFMVVADMFMTPTAAIADIILPAATYLEFPSIVTPPYSYPVMSVQQSCTRVGQCRSDYEILKALAHHLGFGQHFWENEEACLDFVLWPSGVTFEELKKMGFIRGTLKYRDYMSDGFDTPSKKVEFASSRLESWGFDPLPEYREPPGTPYSTLELAKDYPLIYITWKAAPYRHSSGRQIPMLRRQHPVPEVLIHPKTAEALEIGEGDAVYIETPRGRILQTAHLSDQLPLKVVGVDYAWWFPERDSAKIFDWYLSNINILTADATSINPELGSTNLRGGLCRLTKAKNF
jgi:anaerobic selenocysteine-containing dehydrogenase